MPITSEEVYCPIHLLLLREGSTTEIAMPRVCHFLGTKTKSGNRKRYRGRPKYLGGVGIKITSKTKRTFKPNLQTVRAIVDGVPKKVKASTKAIRIGLVVKAARRKYTYTRQQKVESGT